MRISDWSSDVGSADLEQSRGRQSGFHKSRGVGRGTPGWSEGRGRDDFGSGAQVKPALVQLGKGRLKHAAGRPMTMMRSVGAERHGVACLGHAAAPIFAPTCWKEPFVMPRRFYLTMGEIGRA